MDVHFLKTFLLLRFTRYVASMIRSIVVVIALSVAILPSLSSSESLTGLKFDNDLRSSSVVVFRPDMSQLREKLSFCVWIKNLREYGSPMPFAYNKYELFFKTDMGDNHVETYVFYERGYIREDKFQTPIGAWVQWCGTWSFESRQFRFYINGTLADQHATPAGPWGLHKVSSGGTLVLGDFQDTTNGRRTGNKFGGEMFGLNFFAKELTSEEITELSTDGLCTEIPESLETYRLIRWEDILELPRNENIRNIEIQCKVGASIDILKSSSFC